MKLTAVSEVMEDRVFENFELDQAKDARNMIIR